MIRLVLLRGGGGSLGGVSSWLGDWGLANWTLGALDGGSASDSDLAEISTVSGLGDSVGNGLVGPVKQDSQYLSSSGL